jgi:hypothetical protein
MKPVIAREDYELMIRENLLPKEDEKPMLASAGVAM